RRHTRWPRDWSSDVCSSDLTGNGKGETYGAHANESRKVSQRCRTEARGIAAETGRPHGRRSPLSRTASLSRRHDRDAFGPRKRRSEERRVGKECRARWVGYY